MNRMIIICTMFFVLNPSNISVSSDCGRQTKAREAVQPARFFRTKTWHFRNLSWFWDPTIQGIEYIKRGSLSPRWKCLYEAFLTFWPHIGLEDRKKTQKFCFHYVKMAFSSLSVRVLNKNLRPLLTRNIPLISGKYGLRSHFWPLESGFLMRKSEKKSPNFLLWYGLILKFTYLESTHQIRQFAKNRIFGSFFLFVMSSGLMWPFHLSLANAEVEIKMHYLMFWDFSSKAQQQKLIE